jgi:hypothetical protein
MLPTAVDTHIFDAMTWEIPKVFCCKICVLHACGYCKSSRVLGISKLKPGEYVLVAVVGMKRYAVISSVASCFREGLKRSRRRNNGQMRLSGVT